MKIITKTVSKNTIMKEYNHYFGKMIKAVVDVAKRTMAVDAELHADLEALLLSKGSGQQNLWGINLFLDKPKKNWIEYTALINIRPSTGNRGMEIESRALRKNIEKIVMTLVGE